MSASNKKKLRKEQNNTKMTARQTQAEKEAKQLKRYTFTFVTILVAIVVAALAIVSVRGVVQSGMLQKNSVAAIVGNHEINAVELSYYYNDAISQAYQEWNNQYGSNAAIYLQILNNLNLSLPLDEQVQDAKTGKTWADYFVDLALEDAKHTYMLCDLANAAGFKLDQETLDSIDSQIGILPLYASLSGYSSAEKYLGAPYCYGADEESYRDYMTKNALANAYLAHYAEELKYTDEDIRNFEKEKLNNYNSYSYSAVYLSYTNFLGEQKKDADGKLIPYTEDDNNAARAKAKEVAEALLSAKTFDELKLAVDNLDINKDAEGKKLEKPVVSASDYKNVFGASLPSLLTAWITDSSRVAGDSGIVVNEVTDTTTTDKTEGEGEGEKEEPKKTINGYYVVIFNGMNDNKVSTVDVRHLLVSFVHEGNNNQKDADGKVTYSQEEKDAAKAKAEKLLKDLEAMEGGKTEENFKTLVHDNTDDTGSKETGGLYENISYDQNYVEPFLNWALDEKRTAGEVDIIETEYGFHIMYFVEVNEMNYRDLVISEEMRADDTQKWYDENLKTVSTEKKEMKWIKLDTVIGG